MSLLGDLPANADVATAISTKGLLSARPTFGVTGRFYEATDVNVLFRDTGTAWEIVSNHQLTGTFAERPAAGQAGRWYAPSDQTGVIYRDDGTSWTSVILPLAAGLFSARPTAGVNGRIYEATDLSVLYRDTGAAWVALPLALTAGVLASRPAAAVAGRIYEATDVNVLYRDTGAAWAAIPLPLAGTLAERPAAAVAGRLYEATDIGVVFRDTGSAWTPLAGGAKGTIAARPGSGVIGRTYEATDVGKKALYRDNGSQWQRLIRDSDIGGIWDVRSVDYPPEVLVSGGTYVSNQGVVTVAPPVQGLSKAFLLLSFRAQLKKLSGETGASLDMRIRLSNTTGTVTGLPSTLRTVGNKGNAENVELTGFLAGSAPIVDGLIRSDSSSANGIITAISGSGDWGDYYATNPQVMGGMLIVPLGTISEVGEITIEMQYRQSGTANFYAHGQVMWAALVGK